ncbi:MAG: type II toxin-antitoxin system VapC family toxin [Chloroflexi bacterium]|nr:type II toxin-antitoxin system VapC family toxin [Chloroflexota bacterium]
MTVIDASLVVDAIQGSVNSPALAALKEARQPLSAPQLIDLEVLSALRRLAQTNQLSEADADEGVRRFLSLPVRRHDHLPLLDRVWQLRHQVSAYDAAYIALAEGLGDEVLTRDQRLANAYGISCRVRVV